MSEPIDMILHCPVCGTQHIDAPEPDNGWTNPPHKSHLCHSCKTVWRPADVPTNGVKEIKTRGEADTWPKKHTHVGYCKLSPTLAGLDDAPKLITRFDPVIEISKEWAFVKILSDGLESAPNASLQTNPHLRSFSFKFPCIWPLVGELEKDEKEGGGVETLPQGNETGADV